MYGRAPGAGIDLSRLRLTRLRVFALAALLLAIAISVSIVQFSSAKDLILPGGAVIGGDFLVFDTAALAALRGDAAAIYDPVYFEALLHEVAPPRERYGLTWQYPPPYLMLVLPLAFIAYAPGYALWTGGTALAFIAAMRSAGMKGLLLFVIIASPPAFQAVITGQNGFLSAALLTIAALYPDKRPIVAGLAAALLTVKPQLGALLPIAYLAGGCWRAFAAASLGAVALAAASTVAFGPEIWPAFLSGLRSTSENLAGGLMPLFKMATPFAAARFAGLPLDAATTLHAAFAATAALAVALVWRRVKDSELRAATLAVGAFFVAPYAYYYELVILALPAAIVARRAIEKGWLRYEKLLMLAAFLTPMALPGQSMRVGFSWGFLSVLIVAALVVRRVAAEQPGAFRLGVQVRQRSVPPATGLTNPPAASR